MRTGSKAENSHKRRHIMHNEVVRIRGLTYTHEKGWSRFLLTLVQFTTNDAK
jgi:hypothetical protein